MPLILCAPPGCESHAGTRMKKKSVPVFVPHIVPHKGVPQAHQTVFCFPFISVFLNVIQTRGHDLGFLCHYLTCDIAKSCMPLPSHEPEELLKLQFSFANLKMTWAVGEVGLGCSVLSFRTWWPPRGWRIGMESAMWWRRVRGTLRFNTPGVLRPGTTADPTGRMVTASFIVCIW